MARTYTITALIAKIRQRADAENSQFVTDAEIQGYLSTLYAELYELLVASGHRFFESEASISTVAGTRDYALPTDFMGLIAVDWYDNPYYHELYEMMVHERNRYTYITGYTRSWGFQVVGTNLRLCPTPASVQTYRLTYVPLPLELIGLDPSTTSVDVKVPAGEEFLVWGCARMILAKEESDATIAHANFERARQRLEEMREHRIMTYSRRPQMDPLDTPDYDPADWRHGGDGDGW